MARQVFDHEVFQDHGRHNHDWAEAVVREAFPELDRRMVSQAMYRAWRLDRAEAKLAREAAIAADARERHADGEPKVSIATSYGMSANVLTRLMRQNPPP